MKYSKSSLNKFRGTAFLKFTKCIETLVLVNSSQMHIEDFALNSSYILKENDLRECIPQEHTSHWVKGVDIPDTKIG